MILKKYKVCASCKTVDRSDCVCMYENNYPTILLEFEVCKCCNNINDFPANTEFNYNQLKNDKK